MESLYHPELRHGIILAKNKLAKRAEVKTGKAILEAKQKCPGLVVLPPNYKCYQRFSAMARELYGDYSPCVEPFGLDEAWVDITGYAADMAAGEAIADEIRCRVNEELGLTCSAGVSFNKVFATDRG